MAGVVDDDGTGRGGPRREGGRDLGAGGREHDIGALEIEGVERTDLQDLVLAERDFGAGRAFGGQGNDIVDGKLALGQDLQHFPPDIARGADHGYAITHDILASLAMAPARLGDDARSTNAQKQKGRIGMRPLFWDESPNGRVYTPVFLPVVLVAVVVVATAMTAASPVGSAASVVFAII